MLISTNLRLLLATLVAATSWLASCAEREPTSAAAVREPQARSASAALPQVDAAQGALLPAEGGDAAPAEQAAWDPVRLEDEAPLCVFSDHLERGRASFLRDVQKQTLAANARVVFGAFAPGCIQEACDTGPTLHCSVESGPSNTLVVHSRLSFSHKRGTLCSENCRRVIAGCESDVLRPGKYTVKYGSKTFSLRIPSVLRSPCFKQE